MPYLTKSQIANRLGKLALRTKNKKQRCEWTSEEDELMKKYYKTEGAISMTSRLPHHSRGSIQGRAQKLGLIYDLWTEEEIQLLKDNYETQGADKCCNIIPDKSIYQIKRKANNLNLKYVSDKLWSEQEITFLRENRQHKTIKELQNVLKNKTHNQIERKLSELKIYSNKHKKSVICIETQFIYESATSAVKETGITSIPYCCRGKSPMAGGYHWKYVDDLSDEEKLKYGITNKD